MNKLKIIIAILVILVVLQACLLCNSNRKEELHDAYVGGYEQCSHDTALYLRIEPLHRGMPCGLRYYLREKKPSPQTTEDMYRLLQASRKAYVPFRSLKIKAEGAK